jgi:hypothetical protein
VSERQARRERREARIVVGRPSNSERGGQYRDENAVKRVANCGCGQLPDDAQRRKVVCMRARGLFAETLGRRLAGKGRRACGKSAQECG